MVKGKSGQMDGIRIRSEGEIYITGEGEGMMSKSVEQSGEYICMLIALAPAPES